MVEKKEIIQQLLRHLESKDYPCIEAHDAASKQTLSCFVADHMACPVDDHAILNFIYEFVKDYRTALKGYHSVAIIFREPIRLDEILFDKLLWSRLQSLADLYALQYRYDPRVEIDVTSPHFSFSLKEEAFYINTSALITASGRLTDDGYTASDGVTLTPRATRIVVEAKSDDRKNLPAGRRRAAHLCNLGTGRCVSCRPARMAPRMAASACCWSSVIA